MPLILLDILSNFLNVFNEIVHFAKKWIRLAASL